MGRHWIAQMRRAFCISQMSLAVLCGVSSQTIFRWEHAPDGELYFVNDVLTALYLLWKDRKTWASTRGVIQLYATEGRGPFLRELFALAFFPEKGKTR